MEYLIAAFSMGLMGSLHCLGMCGPIVLSVPFTKSLYGKQLSMVTYHSGRILTYAALGSLLGFLGKGAMLVGLRDAISILTGSLILVFVLFPRLLGGVDQGLSKRVGRSLSGAIRKRWQKRNLLSFFALGGLNGLLPCGMVYMAATASLSTASPINGALFMALFGTGTFPLLFLLPLLGDWAKERMNLSFRKVIPVLGVILGVFFIVRGVL